MKKYFLVFIFVLSLFDFIRGQSSAVLLSNCGNSDSVSKLDNCRAFDTQNQYCCLISGVVEGVSVTYCSYLSKANFSNLLGGTFNNSKGQLTFSCGSSFIKYSYSSILIIFFIMNVIFS